jgi:hypothetical protein
MSEAAGWVGWLRLVRMLAQYIAPALVALALVAEIAGATASGNINGMFLGVFGPLTIVMISICGWTVFLWDIDRLFFRLENKIDTELGSPAKSN